MDSGSVFPETSIEVVMEEGVATDPLMLEMSILAGLGFTLTPAENDAVVIDGGGESDVC